MAGAANTSRGTVTRADVARHAGVSTAVVSYVLTGARAVRPETEGRVRQAIEELGYRPNATARALRTGRTDTLGVVFADVSNPYFGEFALEIEAAARARGRSIMMANSHADPQNEVRLVRTLLDRQVDGLIVASVFNAAQRPATLDARTPAVWIDAFDSDPEVASIGSDYVEGARMVTSHLIEHHQHRSVALAVGASHRDSVDPRKVGWHAVLQDAGLPLDDVVKTEWSREGGLLAGRALLTGRVPPEAIFAGSDLMAIGVLRAAHEAGLRVPEDLAIVSFDGTMETQYSAPSLTTHRQRISDMARLAVATITAEEPPAPCHTTFTGDLIIRESCGCAATG